MDEKTTLAGSPAGFAEPPNPAGARLEPTEADGCPRGLGAIPASAFATMASPTSAAAREPWRPPPVADRRRPLPEVLGFEVLGELGRGGMGVVYLARRTILNRPCALKMILAAEHASAEAGVRFLVEAEAVARVHHPNVIQIYSIGTRGELPYLELEYADGGSLEKRLDGVPWDPRRAALMVETLARAVAEAHRIGLVHRDLKPANVLLMADGTPKVADFGLAKGLESGHGLTRTESVMGSPTYMAPEQAEGHTKDVGPTADVYSLGAILYELLCGRPPFRGSTALQTLEQVRKLDPVPPSRLVPSTPRDVETIALKCLQKDAASRYPGAAALAEDLRRFLAREPILARPIGRAERLLRWCQRSPALAAMAAALILVAALGFGGVAWQWRHAVEARDLAVRSKDEAVAHREMADRLAGEKTAALAVARRQTYRSSVAAASAALQLNNAGTARAALALAPEEDRNTWEWRHLAASIDNSRSASRLPGRPPSGPTAFSPDGKHATVQVDGGRLELCDIPGRRVVATCPSDPSAARPAFSADGRLAVLCSPGGAPEVVATADGKSGTLPTPAGVRIRSARFRPDGGRIVGLGDDGRLRAWDPTTRSEIASWPVPDLTPDAAALGFDFRPDGRWIAAGGQGHVRLIDPETGTVVRTLDVPPTRRSLAFSPDGRRLAIGFDFPDNSVRLWDLAAGGPPAIIRGHTNQVSVVGFSPDGARLVSGSMDQTIRAWDGVTGAPLGVLRGHSGTITDLAFDPGRPRLISSSEDRTLRLWDLSHFETIAVLRGHEQIVNHAAYIDGGSTVESYSADGELRFWDPASLERNGVLRGHASFVHDIAFAPDGSRLASVAWDGTARIWDVESGRTLEVLRQGSAILTSASLGTEGTRLAVLEREGDRVAVWDLRSARRLFAAAVPNSSTYQSPRASLDPGGKILAASGKDGLIRFFDAATGAPNGAIPAHVGQVDDVAFRPDGARFASAGTDRTVRIWDAETRAPLRTLGDHPDRAYRLAYSPDGRLLAVSSSSTVTLWEPDTGRKLAVLPQAGMAYGMSFSPDGARLAVGCSDNTIRIWDVAALEEVVELRGHDDYIHAVAFSPDGTRLASASGDCTIRIWDTLPARERGRH